MAIRHRNQGAPLAQCEESRILVRFGVRIGFLGTTPGEGDGGFGFADAGEMADSVMISTEKGGGPHKGSVFFESAPASVLAPPCEMMGFSAITRSLTICPPMRCSWIMRSRFSVLQSRYQVPSG